EAQETILVDLVAYVVVDTRRSLIAAAARARGAYIVEVGQRRAARRAEIRLACFGEPRDARCRNYVSGERRARVRIFRDFSHSGKIAAEHLRCGHIRIADVALPDALPFVVGKEECFVANNPSAG